ncbi:MAG: FAD-dependent oxidoreductase, partial [Dehalococcoidia bacterium]
RMARLTKLFEPIQVGRLELRNRIKMPAMVLAPQGPDDAVIDRLKPLYVERAKGGVAIMGVSCTPTRLVQDPMLGLHDDRFIRGLTQLTEAVRAHGAKVYAQMGVGYSWAFSDGPVELVGPSGVSLSGRPGTPFRLGGPLEPTMPRALSAGEIHEIVRGYGEGARRAREAGFDAVEVIASVGYIIAQFLSPLTNLRADEYGGSLENRMRFLLEIVESMRKRAGADFTCTCRLSGDDLLDGGYTLDETVAMAPMLEKAGIHEIDVMSGWHNAAVPIIQADVPQGAWAHMAEAVKKAVSIPVAAGTQIQDVEVAERVLAEGKADMVYMARALLADPELPNKAKLGQLGNIRPCISCCRCVESADSPPVYCSVNARLGREPEYPGVTPATQRKRVLVAGGGPAGMEAARVAASRGHTVTLCERGSRLGGSLIAAAATNRRIGKSVKHLVGQVRTLPIDLRLDTEVTPALLDEIKPDVLVLATGGKASRLNVPGGDGPNVLDVHNVKEILSRRTKRVVIVGGGFIGCQLGVELVGRGKKVAIVEESKRIGADVGMVHRWVWIKQLREAGARLETGAMVVEITGEGVKIDRAGSADFIEADTVVRAGEFEPDTELAERFSGKVPAIHAVGDCAGPGKLLEAIASGFLVGQEI